MPLLFLSHVLYSALIDWLIFKVEILLTARADQLLYNLSLIKLCLAYVKQNTAVKAACDACSLLAE